MVYNIAIDADSIIYKSCYRHQLNRTKATPYTDEEILESFNLEKAYFELCQEIGKIRSAPFAGQMPVLQYEKGDEVDCLIVFSPRKSFRQDIYPEYKANRKDNSVVGIKELKLLVIDRLKDWCLIVPNVEADDIVNYYAREHNYMVAAIDKDVINANPTYCYNYNTFEWNLPKSQLFIKDWYLMQTLMGDTTDNIKGAKGIGKVGALKIVQELDSPSFGDIIQYFDSETDAMLNHWLVRMDQWNGTEINLWQRELIEDYL